MQKGCEKGGKTERDPNFRLGVLDFFLVQKHPQNLPQGRLLLSVSSV